MAKKPKKKLEVDGEMPNDLITQKDAAELRGVELPTLNQWVRRGRVAGYDLYGRKLVSRSEVMSYKPEASKGGRPRKDQ